MCGMRILLQNETEVRARLRAEYRVFATPTCWVHFRSTRLDELNREWSSLHKEYDKTQASIVGEVLEVAGACASRVHLEVRARGEEIGAVHANYARLHTVANA